MRKLIKPAFLLGVGVVAVGLVAAPLASAANQSATTTINATVNPVISISTSTTVAFAVTPTLAGSASSASDTVTVSTNRNSGYNLKLEDNDATNTLVNGPNTISATTGTFASPAAMSANSWGYRVDGAGTFGAGPTSAQTDAASLSGTWAAVPVLGSPNTIKTTASTASGDTTTVWYGAFVTTAKPDGLYSDVVKYTATTN